MYYKKKEKQCQKNTLKINNARKKRMPYIQDKSI